MSELSVERLRQMNNAIFRFQEEHAGCHPDDDELMPEQMLARALAALDAVVAERDQALALQQTTLDMLTACTAERESLAEAAKRFLEVDREYHSHPEQNYRAMLEARLHLSSRAALGADAMEGL